MTDRMRHKVIAETSHARKADDLAVFLAPILPPWGDWPAMIEQHAGGNEVRAAFYQWLYNGSRHRVARTLNSGNHSD